VPLSLNIVTAERTIVERDDVLRLIVPAAEGQITILPSHAPLMTSLGYGEMLAVVPGGDTIAVAIFGGFLQVVHDQVTVLADAAERAEDINEERAEAARQRAQQRIAGQLTDGFPVDLARARLALERSSVRIRVRRRARPGTGVPSMQR
jgi:F-type H+-transporting ATPase subunit epsilon